MGLVCITIPPAIYSNPLATGNDIIKGCIYYSGNNSMINPNPESSPADKKELTEITAKPKPEQQQEESPNKGDGRQK